MHRLTLYMVLISFLAVCSGIRSNDANTLLFGAMLSDSSISVGSTLNDSVLQQALVDITWLRLSVGPCDYSLSNYDWDANGSVFDRNVKIPFLQRLIKLAPHVQFMASPWSPPQHMCENNQNSPCQIPNNSGFPSKYAQVLAGWHKTYATAGINISYLSLQNEPMYATNGYPSFNLDADRAVSLRNELTKVDPTINVLVFDHNPTSEGIAYAWKVLNNTQSENDIIGWHLYGGSLADTKQFQPRKQYVTEITSSKGDDPSGSYNWAKGKVCLSHSLDFSGYVYYNLFLEPNGLPNIRHDGYVALPLFEVNNKNIDNTWVVDKLFKDFTNNPNMCNTVSLS